MKDPRKVGGRYFSGYWKKEYEVLERKGSWFRVEWLPERSESTHCTPWDEKRDRIIQH